MAQEPINNVAAHADKATTALEQHYAFMVQGGNAAEDIKSQVAGSYRTDTSSATFLTKYEAWHEAYTQAMQAVERTRQNLSDANVKLTQGEQQSLDEANNSFHQQAAEDEIYTMLTPHGASA